MVPFRGPTTHPKSRSQTFSRSSRELLPSSLWHESGTQRKLFGWTVLFWVDFFGWIFLSESVSTGVWRVPGLGAGFEIALEPSNCRRRRTSCKRSLLFSARQTLACTKPWFKRNLILLWYTPARNYCEINSENIISCNWNEIFQENNSQNIFHEILWITNEYVICNFREINSRTIFLNQVALQRCNVNFLARFLGWILEGEFWEVNFSTVNFSGASFPGKNRTKKFDPRIRVRNSGVQNSFSRIRAQIRVSEVQNPLCRNSSLNISCNWNDILFGKVIPKANLYVCNLSG